MRPDETTTGLRFGSYEVLTRADGTLWELGAGGFGRTFRARHRLLGTEVALKVIHDRHAFDSRAKARFIREAQEQAGLVHPGIARITYCDEVDGTLFYVMDLCDGGDLQHFVDQAGPLSPAETLYLIEQAVDAMAFAHGRGLIHRDIKPSNLLLVHTDQGMPILKLIDFGLVKRVDGTPEATASMITQDGQSLFSPAFASPEQMREQVLDARSDIFSMGMTMWFLLVGGRPIEGSTAEIVSDRLNTQEYEKRLPPAITGAARAVLVKMVSKSPADRYQSSKELLDDIRSCRKSLPVPVSDWRQRQRRQASLHERYDVTPSAQSSLGPVFRGRDRRSDAKVDVTVLRKELPATQQQQILQTAKRLAETRHAGLVQYFEVEQYEEGWAVVREHPGGDSLLDLLRRHGPAGMERALPLLQELASSFDLLEQLRVPSVAAHPSEIILQARAGSGESRRTDGRFDWQGWRPRLLPQLNSAGRSESDPNVTAVETIVSSDGDFRSGFAGLIYWLVSGKAVPGAARMSASGYSAIPGLGEESNRILAQVISGGHEVESCQALLKQLQSVEGISEKKVEAERRRALWEMFNTVAVDAEKDLLLLNGATDEVDRLAAGCVEAQAFIVDAAGFRQQAQDAMLSLGQDALPETASSTILYASLNEAEGALNIIREAAAGAVLLRDRARTVTAEAAERHERLRDSLARAAGVIAPARAEAAQLLSQAAAAAQTAPEAAELLVSVQQWTERVAAQAAELERLNEFRPSGAQETERAVVQADQAAAQAAQALDQTRNWSRQILRLSDRVRQQAEEEASAREQAISQLDAHNSQGQSFAAAAARDAATAAEAAAVAPEAADAAAVAQQAANTCAELLQSLGSLRGGAGALSLSELRHAAARSHELLSQIREEHGTAAQAARESAGIRGNREAARRREVELTLSACARFTESAARLAETAEASVAEMDQLSRRHESVGERFVKASRSCRTVTQAARELEALHTRLEEGDITSAVEIHSAAEAWYAQAETGAAEVNALRTDAFRMVSEEESRAQAEERDREAVHRALHQCTANAETSFHKAREAVSALPEEDEIPEEGKVEARAIHENMRQARLILRGMQEAVAAVATARPEYFPSMAESAPARLHEVTQLCGEIRQAAALLQRWLTEGTQSYQRADSTQYVQSAAQAVPEPIPASAAKPKGSKTPALLITGAVLLLGGAGAAYVLKKPAPSQAGGTTTPTPPAVPAIPAADDFVCILEFTGVDLPADLASVSLLDVEALGGLRIDSADRHKASVRIKGKPGAPFRLQLPPGYESPPQLVTAADTPVSVDVRRTQGQVTLSGSIDSFYTQAVFVWRSSLPSEPQAAPPPNLETKAPISSTGISLPTGQYMLFVDDADGVTDPVIQRRTVGEVLVESGQEPRVLKLPVPWPRSFTGSVLMRLGDVPARKTVLTVIKNGLTTLDEAVRKVRGKNGMPPPAAGWKFTYPVISQSEWLYPSRSEFTIGTDFNAELTVSNDRDFVEFFRKSGVAIAALSSDNDPAKVDGLFTGLAQMTSWNFAEEAMASMDAVAAALAPENLTAKGFLKVEEITPMLAQVTQMKTQFERQSLSQRIPLRVKSVDADGTMTFGGEESGMVREFTVRPAEDGLWNLKGQETNVEQNALRNLSGLMTPGAPAGR